jgi:hypothetical protein
MKSRTVYSFTQARSKSLAAARAKPQAAELAKTITSVLKLPPRKGTPDYRILRPVSGRNYPKPSFTSYAIETEPGMVAVVYRLSDQTHLSRPPRDAEKRAILYVSHHSADAELRDEPLLAELVKGEPESAFYTCDVRGIGETRPNTCGGASAFLTPYGNDYFYAIHGLMLDRPYVGQRTFDVLRLLDWLASLGHKEVHLVAKGWGSIPATFAAVLSDAVAQVTLKNALTSYSDVAESELYSWPLSSFAPAVLESFDLPDCYRALKGKKLKQIDLLGAAGKV